MGVNQTLAKPDAVSAAAAALAEVCGMSARSDTCLDNTELRPIPPSTGGVPGVWVTADGSAMTANGVIIYLHAGGFESP